MTKVDISSSKDGYMIINLTLPDGDIYGVETDDGSLSQSIDSLMDMVLEKKFDLNRTKVLSAAIKFYRDNGGI